MILEPSRWSGTEACDEGLDIEFDDCLFDDNVLLKWVKINRCIKQEFLYEEGLSGDEWKQ